MNCTFALAYSATKTITVTCSVGGSLAPEQESASDSSLALDFRRVTGPATVDITRSVALVVTKTFADNSVDAGTSGHSFTLSVKNNGPSDATAVHLTDTVDNRLTVTAVSESGAGQACAASTGQSINCTFDLAYNATKTITVTYSVGASVAPATVSNSSNDSASAETSAPSPHNALPTRSVALVVTK